MRILLADDSPVNVLVARRTLARWGGACDTAADGREALALWERGAYDLVLMDGQMPEMDGYAATRRIRELEAARGGERPRVAIVAMTAAAMPGDRERCLEAGMDDYVVKPLRPDVLLDVLRRVLAARPA